MTRNVLYAIRAKRAGARYSLRIVQEAQRAKVPISLAFAICEQETGFRNVFGHDPTIFVGAGEVTKKKYLAYKAQRGHTRMQGVGPMQLTWWATQDRADQYGGCWKPAYNIRVGLEQLAANVRQHGERAGITAYNGAGPAAQAYATSALNRKAKWHRILTKGK
jgi:hypothetical protein